MNRLLESIITSDPTQDAPTKDCNDCVPMTIEDFDDLEDNEADNRYEQRSDN